MRKVRLFLRLSFLIAFLVACQGLIFARPVLAQSSAAKPHKVVIYLFWGDGCPHCAVAKPFLNELTQRYPKIELRAYEVWYVPENQEPFLKGARHTVLSRMAYQPFSSETNTGKDTVTRSGKRSKQP